MTDYFLDVVSGSDAADGLSWGNAKKTPAAFNGFGLTSADTIKIAKNAEASAITGTFSLADHASGGSSFITGTAALGVSDILQDLSSQTLTVYNSATTGTSSTKGTYIPSYNTSRTTLGSLTGRYLTLPASPAASTKYGVLDLGSQQDWSSYQEFHMWIGMADYVWQNSTSPYNDNDTLRVKLCSDSAGDTVITDMDWEIKPPCLTKGGFWLKFTPPTNLPSVIQSIAIYSGANTIASARIGLCCFALVKTTATVRPGDFIQDPTDGLWSRIPFIRDGETATPDLYLLSVTGSNGFWPIEFTGRTINCVPQTQVFTRSDFTGNSYTEIAAGHALTFATYDGVLWEGGYDTGSDLVTGWTMFDLGMDNGGGSISSTAGYGYVLHMDYDTANNGTKDFKASNIITSGGYCGGGIPGHPNTIIYYNTFTKDNCIACPGTLHTWNFSTATNASDCYITNSFSYGDAWRGSNSNWLYDFSQRQTACVRSYNNCVLLDVLFGTWAMEGTVDFTDTKFIHPSLKLVFEGFTRYRLNLSNVSLWGSGTFTVEDMQDESVPKVWSFDIRGPSLNCLRIAGHNTIDGLTFVKAGYTGQYIRIRRNFSNNPGFVANYPAKMFSEEYAIKNLNIQEATDIRIGRCRVDDSIINFSGTFYADEISHCPPHFRNCTIESTDGLAFDFLYEDSISFYNCTIGWMDAKPGNRYSKFEMHGGSFGGYQYSLQTDVNDDYPMGGGPMSCHNVTFDKGDFFTNIESKFSSSNSTLQHAWLSPRDSWWRFSSINGSVGDTRMYSPYAFITTGNSPLRTAGGKSWEVYLKGDNSEGYAEWSLAQVAVKTGVLLTAKIYVYVNDAAEKVVFGAWGGQVGTNMVDQRAISTGQVGVWEEVSVSFTPNADGVVQFYVTFEGASGQSLYLDDILFQQ